LDPPVWGLMGWRFADQLSADIFRFSVESALFLPLSTAAC
jgi:hypothetical protein